MTAICIGCGCSDDDACLDEHDEPCHWILVDPIWSRGVCSACPGEVRRFIKGDRAIAQEAAA